MVDDYLKGAGIGGGLTGDPGMAATGAGIGAARGTNLGKLWAAPFDTIPGHIMNTITGAPGQGAASMQSAQSGIQYKPFSSDQGWMQNYGSQLFNNMGLQAKAQGNAARQAAIDETSRFPGMAGAQQKRMQQTQQGIPDQMLNLNQQAQLGAIGEDLADTRTSRQNAFTAAQNDLARQQAANQLNATLQQDAYQYGEDRRDRMMAGILASMNGIVSKSMKGVGSGIGGAMGGGMASSAMG